MSPNPPSSPNHPRNESQVLEIALPGAVVLSLMIFAIFRRQLNRARYQLAVAQLRNEAASACLRTDADAIKCLADELTRLCEEVLRKGDAQPVSYGSTDFSAAHRSETGTAWSLMLSETRLSFQGSLYDADDEEAESSSSDTDKEETESTSSTITEEEVSRVGEVRRGYGELVIPDDVRPYEAQVAEVVDADDYHHAGGDEDISKKHIERDRDSTIDYADSGALSDLDSVVSVD
ncbi:hypothetical protein B0T19DRAFT_445680 [Cercophora scortea]|uniref:Uncharacterized protein n=1 Tax=Cercophora scortea TaxID=314031 RepID=A0AAE0M586_9PEZI|nr:hypothetical protein B0T19DRAFT_445680 [Cercophora scortea]